MLAYPQHQQQQQQQQQAAAQHQAHQPQQPQQQQQQQQVPQYTRPAMKPAVRRAIKIVDPNTNKPIQIGVQGKTSDACTCTSCC
jgi:hypothetical protein